MALCVQWEWVRSNEFKLKSKGKVRDGRTLFAREDSGHVSGKTETPGTGSLSNLSLISQGLIGGYFAWIF